MKCLANIIGQLVRCYAAWHGKELLLTFMKEGAVALRILSPRVAPYAHASVLPGVFALVMRVVYGWIASPGGKQLVEGRIERVL